MIGFHPVAERARSDAPNVNEVIQKHVRDIISTLQSQAGHSRSNPEPAAIRHVMVGDERFRLVVELMPPNGRGDSVPIVTVERVNDYGPAERALRERYRLTQKETRVAFLLGQRRSNAEIAETLHISPHTARRHTENVMLKLNVTSRYSVESALMAVA